MREIEGEGRYRAMRPGLRFGKTPSTIRFDPPKIGEHTGQIMREVGD
jgi:crotonobetainyl-CoA:carnitine CoA-transferase CaiB-like acyl-CoA transferase